MIQRIKILEHKIENGLEQLERLHRVGIDKSMLIGLYKKELQLEQALIDYILISHNIKDNKINQYVENLKKYIK